MLPHLLEPRAADRSQERRDSSEGSHVHFLRPRLTYAERLCSFLTVETENRQFCQVCVSELAEEEGRELCMGLAPVQSKLLAWRLFCCDGGKHCGVFCCVFFFSFF